MQRSYVDGDPVTRVSSACSAPTSCAERQRHANSVQAVDAILQERLQADRTYDGYYPSLNLTFNVKENLLVRLGYAKTMPPDYTTSSEYRRQLRPQ